MAKGLYVEAGKSKEERSDTTRWGLSVGVRSDRKDKDDESTDRDEAVMPTPIRRTRSV